MHYCQVCQVAVAMVAEPPVARCPHCGAAARVLTEPLFVVAGASGSGKTTIVPHLADALDECVVFDVDWLLDSLGNDNWPRFRDSWLAVAHGVAQGRRSTVLCGPFIPDHLEDLPARSWLGAIHYATLDAPDDVLRARIDARPQWRTREIEKQIEFARWLRINTATSFSTHDRPPQRTAADIAGWVRHSRASS